MSDGREKASVETLDWLQQQQLYDDDTQMVMSGGIDTKLHLFELDESVLADGPDAAPFYGYPWCFSEYKLPAAYAKGATAQWSWPNSGKSDGWCEANAIRPELVMQAHTAPLGLASADASALIAARCAPTFPSAPNPARNDGRPIAARTLSPPPVFPIGICCMS